MTTLNLRIGQTTPVALRLVSHYGQRTADFWDSLSSVTRQNEHNLWQRKVKHDDKLVQLFYNTKTNAPTIGMARPTITRSGHLSLSRPDRNSVTRKHNVEQTAVLKLT